MTYQEFISSRVERAELAKTLKEEWLKNADIDQMEIDEGESLQIESLGMDS